MQGGDERMTKGGTQSPTLIQAPTALIESSVLVKASTTLVDSSKFLWKPQFSTTLVVVEASVLIEVPTTLVEVLAVLIEVPTTLIEVLIEASKHLSTRQSSRRSLSS